MSTRGHSLRRRLVTVTVATSGIALLLACFSFLALSAFSDHRQTANNLEALAQIFAYSSAGWLEFEDQSGASELLMGMRAEPEIVRAALYDSDGTLFASYRRLEAGLEPWPAPPPDGPDFEPVSIRITLAVHVGGGRVGTLAIEQSLGALYGRIARSALVVLVVLGACCALVFWSGSGMVGGVTAPILELAHLAREITATQDYTRRSAVPETEEVGVLALTLNAMLDRIEQDMDLRAQREQLECINAALEREKDRALAAARTKSEFLANMSHEIRTPMTAILGYIDLIRGEPLERQEIDGMLEVVQRNGNHLLSVINDILDLSKLEAGRVEIEAVWCSPEEILKDLRQLMDARAVAKGLSLQLEQVGSIPRKIRSDPTRLRQILLNLLSNAIKFTSEGGVRLAVRLNAGGDGQPAALTFQISDTGIGIPRDKHESIFEAFSQADASTTRHFGGTGLGLSISARLAGLLGGTLRLVSSVPGEGTTLALQVPLGATLSELELVEPSLGEAWRSDAPRPQPAAPEPLSGRVLVAEDSRDTQRLVRFLLQKAGLDVDLAENGERACEMATTARESGEPYALILMDMQMPVMDGYTAVRTLRERGFSVPILAFTAHAMSGEREKCVGVGCDDYVSKPIDRVALLALVTSLIKGGAGASGAQ